FQPVAARPQDAPRIQRRSSQISPYLHPERALGTAHRKLISQAPELTWRPGVTGTGAAPHDTGELARHLERQARLAQHGLREDGGEAGAVGERLPPQRGAVRAVVVPAEGARLVGQTAALEDRATERLHVGARPGGAAGPERRIEAADALYYVATEGHAVAR